MLLADGPVGGAPVIRGLAGTTLLPPGILLWKITRKNGFFDSDT